VEDFCSNGSILFCNIRNRSSSYVLERMIMMMMMTIMEFGICLILLKLLYSVTEE
jgi:hypothetical protein